MALEDMGRIRVVGVRPQIAGNVGSVARAMENFAAGQLYLVAPQCKPLSQPALDMSTHGRHRLESARIVERVEDALEGVIYTFATSRRRGPAHQAEELSPRDMAVDARARMAAAGGDIAILFGSEDNGLLREDLLASDALVRVPANPAYPTLNIAQSVVVCLYELFSAIVSDKAFDEPARYTHEPADAAAMVRLTTKLQQALLTVGYLRPEKPDHLMFPIRNILARANLTQTEAKILMGLAQQIEEFAKYGK
jgi:TrmH family RNA methyltransferase